MNPLSEIRQQITRRQKEWIKRGDPAGVRDRPVRHRNHARRVCARKERPRPLRRDGKLTREHNPSGSWKTANLRNNDVKSLPKKAYPVDPPYQRIIAEMREILLEMGFEELYGGIVQQSFWNFDALFQPQDHPAREMQDTFYLRETLPLPPGTRR